MRKILAIGAFLIASNALLAQEKPITMKDTRDSVSHSLGLLIGQNLKDQGFGELNFQILAQSLQAAIAKTIPQSDLMAANAQVQKYQTEMQSSKGDKAKKEGEKFLEENKKRKGVVTLPSGLQYEILKQGSGPKPTATDKVKTHYHGTLIDGTVFDSSVERNDPATFGVNQVIKGWTEALQLMPVGSKWKLFIPYNLAYGERGAGGKIGPYSALIFEVELLSIEK